MRWRTRVLEVHCIYKLLGVVQMSSGISRPWLSRMVGMRLRAVIRMGMDTADVVLTASSALALGRMAWVVALGALRATAFAPLVRRAATGGAEVSITCTRAIMPLSSCSRMWQ